MKFSADKIYNNFFSGESKDYKYVKFHRRYQHFNVRSRLPYKLLHRTVIV